MTRWLAIFSAALLIAFLGYIGPADYADALDREADMKLLRAQLASRSEHIAPASTRTGENRLIGSAPSSATTGVDAGPTFPLLHPLGCGGAWIRNCADFGPCRVTCLGE